jgi:V/A-type H+-transporting ATPase subunit A
MIEGKITRISGPIVFAGGLEGCGLYDVVNVGEKELIGEIIRQNEGKATIQVYEDDTGLHVGEKVVCYERPLSLRLGPGLVGTIYDGIQRPLKSMYEDKGSFLLPGQRTQPLDVTKKWHFETGKDGKGQPVMAGMPIAPGLVLGTVRETQSILHSIMIPPGIRGRVLQTFAGSGDYTVDEVIGTTEMDEEIRLSQYWPVRKPRPYMKKMGVTEPLVTGLRVIDVFFPLSKGGTAAIPGGFGTGKTMTQHAIAKCGPYCIYRLRRARK